VVNYIIVFLSPTSCCFRGVHAEADDPGTAHCYITYVRFDLREITHSHRTSMIARTDGKGERANEGCAGPDGTLLGGLFFVT